MMFICPNCQSQVFTPTGVNVDSVDCGNCGTLIDGSQGQDVRASMATSLASAAGLGSTSRRYVIAAALALGAFVLLLVLGYFD